MSTIVPSTVKGWNASRLSPQPTTAAQSVLASAITASSATQPSGPRGTGERLVAASHTAYGTRP